MLGDRRSNSLFTKEAPAPETPPVAEAPTEDTEGEVNMTEAVSAVEDDSRQELLAQNRIAPKASAVFFGSKNTVDFSKALSQVQGYLSGEYAALITESNAESKDQMKRLMAATFRTTASLWRVLPPTVWWTPSTPRWQSTAS